MSLPEASRARPAAPSWLVSTSGHCSCIGASALPVAIASSTLRQGLRDGDSHRFLASCWVIVEAPRSALPSSTAPRTASLISSTAKPRWSKKPMSSATAAGI